MAMPSPNESNPAQQSGPPKSISAPAVFGGFLGDLLNPGGDAEDLTLVFQSWLPSGSTPDAQTRQGEWLRLHQSFLGLLFSEDPLAGLDDYVTGEWGPLANPIEEMPRALRQRFRLWWGLPANTIPSPTLPNRQLEAYLLADWDRRSQPELEWRTRMAGWKRMPTVQRVLVSVSLVDQIMSLVSLMDPWRSVGWLLEDMREATLVADIVQRKQQDALVTPHSLSQPSHDAQSQNIDHQQQQQQQHDHQSPQGPSSRIPTTGMANMTLVAQAALYAILQVMRDTENLLWQAAVARMAYRLGLLHILGWGATHGDPQGYLNGLERILLCMVSLPRTQLEASLRAGVGHFMCLATPEMLRKGDWSQETDPYTTVAHEMLQPEREMRRLPPRPVPPELQPVIGEVVKVALRRQGSTEMWRSRPDYEMRFLGNEVAQFVSVVFNSGMFRCSSHDSEAVAPVPGGDEGVQEMAIDDRLLLRIAQQAAKHGCWDAAETALACLNRRHVSFEDLLRRPTAPPILGTLAVVVRIHDLALAERNDLVRSQALHAVADYLQRTFLHLHDRLMVETVLDELFLHQDILWRLPQLASQFSRPELDRGRNPGPTWDRADAKQNPGSGAGNDRELGAAPQLELAFTRVYHLTMAISDGRMGMTAVRRLACIVQADLDSHPSMMSELGLNPAGRPDLLRLLAPPEVFARQPDLQPPPGFRRPTQAELQTHYEAASEELHQRTDGLMPTHESSLARVLEVRREVLAITPKEHRFGDGITMGPKKKKKKTGQKKNKKKKKKKNKTGGDTETVASAAVDDSKENEAGQGEDDTGTDDGDDDYDDLPELIPDD